MKPAFDFQRYRLLIKDTMRTSIKDTVMPVIIILGIFLVICIWLLLLQKVNFDHYQPSYYSLHYDYMWGKEIGFFWLGIVLVACLACRIFYPMRNKAGTISYLMLPASNLEKFLSRWSILVLGCLILYIVGFQIIDLIRCLFAVCLFGKDPNIMPIGINHLLVEGSWMGTFAVLFLILMLQSAFALGGTIWPKRGHIYTAMWLLGICVATSAWIGSLAVMFALSSWDWTLVGDGESRNILTQWQGFTLLGITALVVCTINYLLAYYRFKESEIIHRW